MDCVPTRPSKSQSNPRYEHFSTLARLKENSHISSAFFWEVGSEKWFQHQLWCTRAHCCKTDIGEEKASAALCPPARRPHSLPAAWIRGSPETIISLPARDVNWCLLMASPREPVVAAYFSHPRAAEGGTCDSGRESWTGF